MIFSMAGCGKKNIHQGGEGTNFPYTWKEEWKGTILLKLDGTYGPEDYRWTAESTDPSVLEVKVAKKEKKGIVSYRVKALKEGSAQVVFTRQREVPEDQAVESSVTKDNTDGVTPDVKDEMDSVTPDENADIDDFDMQSYLIEDFGAKEQGKTEEDAKAMEVEQDDPEDLEALRLATERYDSFLEQFRAKDVISEITIRFDAEPTGKKEKLKLNFVLANQQEFKGIQQNAGGSIDYKIWEDDTGDLKVRLPETGENWNVTWEGEYIPVEDPGIPGIVVSRPEMVDGRYIILEIQDQGYIEGAHCFIVRGLDQGTATLAFTNPEKQDCLMIDVEISKDGRITVLSHKLASAQG